MRQFNSEYSGHELAQSNVKLTGKTLFPNVLSNICGKVDDRDVNSLDLITDDHSICDKWGKI